MPERQTGLPADENQSVEAVADNAAATSCGCANCGKWPLAGNTTHLAGGRSRVGHALQEGSGSSPAMARQGTDFSRRTASSSANLDSTSAEDVPRSSRQYHVTGSGVGRPLERKSSCAGPESSSVLKLASNNFQMSMKPGALSWSASDRTKAANPADCRD